MEELPNDELVDLESLQAQIDLSLAHTKNLVSSWMKPSTLPSSSKRVDRDKEVQDLLRRPARLGVGAPLPASTSAFGVEGVKLKNKLAGKKRERDSDETVHGGKDRDSEDEDEGRGRAFKKKAKLDPFEGTHGKKKKHRVAVVKEPVAGPTPPATPAKVTKEGPAAPSDVHTTSPESPAPSLLHSAVSERKKKKKKHKLLETDALPTLSHPSPLKPPPSEPSSPGSPFDQRKSKLSLELTDLSPKRSDLLLEQSVKTSPAKATSLLNLDGPPPSDTEEHERSAKKKRKRRKKKKTGDTAGIESKEAHAA